MNATRHHVVLVLLGSLSVACAQSPKGESAPQVQIAQVPESHPPHASEANDQKAATKRVTALPLPIEVAEASASVVEVVSYMGKGGEEPRSYPYLGLSEYKRGLGVVIEAAGFILTTYSLLAKEGSTDLPAVVDVRGLGSGAPHVKATIVGLEPTLDLAILQAALVGPGVRAAKLEGKDLLEPGTKLYAVTGRDGVGSSTFTLSKIATTSGGDNSLNSPDNVDWTAATTLAGTAYPSGLIFVNEDNSSGETWSMTPTGGSKTRVAKTTVGAESTGIFDLSEFVGYRAGSILIANNQGSPASMTLLINPKATTVAACGDLVCASGETAASCPTDCGSTGGGCTDVSGFVDAQGYRCSAWVGYNCRRAVEDYGYTQKQENAILANCRASCGEC